MRLALLCILAALMLGNSSSPLIVNVDSPSFRKIIAAVPSFTFDAKHGESAKIAVYGQKRLQELLEFSRLFMALSTKSSKGKGRKHWQKLGAETLVTGEVKVRKGDKRVALTLRTFDIKRRKMVVQKTYTQVTAKNVDLVIRSFADAVLEAYTKKSGIFFSRIAFVGKRHKKDHKQIYVMDFDGSNLKQITRTPAHHLSPSWSPDNRYVVYTSFEDGNPDLFLYDMKSGKHTKISGRSGINSGGQFAHTGEVVAFTGSLRGDTDIYVTDKRGMYRRRLIKGYGLDVDPTFSPNGKWLAFVSGRYGNPHIFRATLSWKNSHVRVTDDKRLTYAGWYNANPSWSPDSRKIAFAGYDKDIDRFDIFLMNADGSKLERMTLNRGDNESPSWSPNGMMLIFFSTRTSSKYRKGAAKLYVMSRDGSNQKQLYTKLYEAQTPKWSNNRRINEL